MVDKIKSLKKLSIIVPCYNEQDILHSTSTVIEEKLVALIEANLIADSSYVLYIDDGSNDSTWDIIRQKVEKGRNVKALKLSANCGHQSAILAGMSYVDGKVDCAITIDADLQDDIEVISEMISLNYEGYEIVYGVRKGRPEDSFFKKNTALLFYKIMCIMGANIIPDHADFRLVGSKALSALKQYKESALFLRGIFPLMGFNSAKVYYERKKRESGISQYTLSKMISLASNGITAFSVFPLKCISVLGLTVTFLSLLAIVYVLYSFFCKEDVVSGWSSVAVAIFLLGGVQLLCLGILGEYLAKVYLEVKDRPKYIIEEEI